MVFSSTTFLFVFLPALLVLYYLPFIKKREWKNAILLAMSIGFYAWGEPMFVFIMLFCVFLNWGIVLFMDKSVTHKKMWLSAAIVLDVALLAVFKYLSFISENIANLTGNTKLIVEIALPIGISFFTFQMMSYVFDVYYQNAKAQKNPFLLALYISLFPQMIAGPIVRYQDVEREIRYRHENMSEFSDGARRFIYGLAKKVLIANYVARIADNVFDYMEAPSVLMAWLGAIAYTLQIYYDFSGYSDMAIGLGKMFGFHFNENFNYPYIAGSVTSFWRRWHISLSSWFRDYVYIPLGGNRVSKSRWIFNLFVVWLLTGIWHGANWTFLAWGLFYFVILLAEKLCNAGEKNSIISHIYTMIVIVIAWVFFRSNCISDALRYIGNMVGINAGGFSDNAVFEYVKGTWVILLTGIIGVFPWIKKVKPVLEKKNLLWVEDIWIIVIFFLSIFEVVSATYNPFIYFNF